MSLILVIIIFLILFGEGGSGYYEHTYYNMLGLGSVLGVIIIVLIVMWILGR
jgi:hypothetical protein